MDWIAGCIKVSGFDLFNGVACGDSFSLLGVVSAGALLSMFSIISHRCASDSMEIVLLV